MPLGQGWMHSKCYEQNAEAFVVAVDSTGGTPALVIVTASRLSVAKFLIP